jgi:hypothetical protein
LIEPALIGLDRVLAHYAISLIFPERETPSRRYSFELDVLSKEVQRRGTGHLAIGRLRVRSRQTWDEAEAHFAVIHYGGLDFFTVLRRDFPHREFEHLSQRIWEAYRRGSLADVTTIVTREFEGTVHRLDDLFVDEQRRIIGIVLQDRIEDYRRTFERLFTQDEDVLNRLGQVHYPVPKPLGAAAAASLDVQLLQAVARLEQEGSLASIRSLCERGNLWSYQPDRPLLAKSLSEALEATISGLEPGADLAALAAHAELILDAAALLGAAPDLWQAQNQLLDRSVRLSDLGVMDDQLRAVFGRLAARLKISEHLLGWRP